MIKIIAKDIEEFKEIENIIDTTIENDKFLKDFNYCEIIQENQKEYLYFYNTNYEQKRINHINLPIEFKIEKISIFPTDDGYIYKIYVYTEKSIGNNCFKLEFKIQNCDIEILCELK